MELWSFGHYKAAPGSPVDVTGSTWKIQWSSVDVENPKWLYRGVDGQQVA